MNGLSTLELCAGAGGQALGYEQAGFEHVALVEINKHACGTLRLNRPGWKVIEGDLTQFDGLEYRGVDVISGGLPCPPFSVAGKQLGENDERNLFPEMIRLVDQIRPRAVMVENVRGILDAVFSDYRSFVGEQLKALGYTTGWRLMNASDFGVPQLRPRVVFVALRKEYSEHFVWPEQGLSTPKSVGETLHDLMAAGGWQGAERWRQQANEIAPTIVGGSHKHGGPDLGPTRARRFREALIIVRELLANGACRFDGDHYKIDVPVLGPLTTPPPRLIGAASGPWVQRNIAPHVDVVEIAYPGPGNPMKSGTFDFSRIAEITLETIAESCDRVLQSNPDVALSCAVPFAVGTGEAATAMKQMMGDGFYGNCCGDPEAAAENLAKLESIGVSRVTLTAATDESYVLLAKHLPTLA